MKRIPEQRIRRIVQEFQEALIDLQEEYDDETDVESTDSYRADSEAGREGGSLPQEAFPFAAPPEKVTIPPSLVVVDEAKKAKR